VKNGNGDNGDTPDDDVWSALLVSTDRMNKDLRRAAMSLGDAEVRHLVDSYYTMQEDRKRAKAQERALTASKEPHLVITWMAQQAGSLEKQIKVALDAYTENHVMGSWMRQIYGIGPVISAGLLSHIDMDQAPTVGHIWAFAGWASDGQKPWEKGKPRPFNAKLKTLCWKVGQSFMKFSNKDECYYGKIYRERKAYEIGRNEALELKPQADIMAQKVGKTTDAYQSYSIGKLPPAHIDARARRYAVKLFLSHLHGEWHQRYFGKPAPAPYPIAFMGHTHFIPAPVAQGPEEAHP
jgi:hypothetical protein